MSNAISMILSSTIMLFHCIFFIFLSISILFIVVKGKKELEEVNTIFNILFDQEERLFEVIIDGMNNSKRLFCDIKLVWNETKTSTQYIVNSVLEALKTVTSWVGIGPQQCNEANGARCPGKSILDPISYCSSKQCQTSDFTPLTAGIYSNCCTMKNSKIEEIKKESSSSYDCSTNP